MKSRRLTGLVGVVVALMLVLAACGGDDNGGGQVKSGVSFPEGSTMAKLQSAGKVTVGT